LNYLVPASWGAIEDKRNPLARRWPQTTVSHAVVSGGVGALDWVPKQCNQSEKPCGNITGGSPHLEHWEGWGCSFLACCFGSLGSKARRKTSQLNLPHLNLSWRKDISVKFASGTWTCTGYSHGKSLHNRIRGVHSS
jgi:hypothetical protein